MTILPLRPADNASPEALRGFLAQCQAAARRDAQAKLVSISLSVDALDPLAVLESIFEPGEPHFYAERPALETAIAGAEIAMSHEARGAARFADVQRWIAHTTAHTIAVGDVTAPFGGPHFFAGFAFHDDVEPGEPFPAAFVFVPRWQVSLAGTTTTAVANLVIAADTDLEAATQRVWRAHGKFRNFEFGSGTGVSPVMSEADEASQPDTQNGRATPILIRRGANLPHWSRDGAIYAVTFRLADSLPSHVLDRWELERAAILARGNAGDRPLRAAERDELHRLHSDRIETFLDAGTGSCHLAQPRVAEIVANALRHFDGERYELHAWCVMPNHVHVVLRPLSSHRLDQILHSWKSYTAKAANAVLKREGEFWQTEYYDHLIRDESDYTHAMEYVRRNPEKAGLANWPWVGGKHVAALAETSSMGGTPMPLAQAAIGTGPRFTTREAGDYRTTVARALAHIATGELKKIVLARAQDLAADRELHPLRMLNGLRQRFPDCYAFSFAQGRGPSFIGASPERLVRVSQGTLETEALAGSIRRGRSASEDAAFASALLHSEKDLREQREVLDDILARLAPLGISPQFPAQPLIRRLANVQHLHTPLRAALPERVSLLDVLAAMHPTPAVGGSPRAAAIRRIRELEGFPRGLYAGALGWLNARGGGEFFVGIRSALVERTHARVYAGAGIVAGSSPEKEFAETELKFKAMLDALGGVVH